MASKLSLYNDALLLCGETALAALTDENEPRRLLDQVYNTGGIDECLTEAYWTFAIRSVQLDYDPSEDPQFGYVYAFSQPSDWIKTVAVCADEYFRVPLTEYTFEAGFWYTDITPLYIKYISNDANYGYNIGDWPVSFKNYVAAYFASRIALKVTGNVDKTELIMAVLKQARLDAKGEDAQNHPPSFPPTGNWVRSRSGTSRREGGNRNGPLIG